MLNTLHDMEIAQGMMSGTAVSKNVLDKHYESLHCDVEPMDHSDPEYDVIKRYAMNTAGYWQRGGGIVDVFKINRPAQDKRFAKYDGASRGSPLRGRRARPTHSSASVC